MKITRTWQGPQSESTLFHEVLQTVIAVDSNARLLSSPSRQRFYKTIRFNSLVQSVTGIRCPVQFAFFNEYQPKRQYFARAQSSWNSLPTHCILVNHYFIFCSINTHVHAVVAIHTPFLRVGVQMQANGNSNTNLKIEVQAEAEKSCNFGYSIPQEQKDIIQFK